MKGWLGWLRYLDMFVHHKLEPCFCVGFKPPKQIVHDSVRNPAGQFQGIDKRVATTDRERPILPIYVEFFETFEEIPADRATKL
jgi:hypothetical protein